VSISLFLLISSRDELIELLSLLFRTSLMSFFLYCYLKKNSSVKVFKEAKEEGL